MVASKKMMFANKHKTCR